MGTKELVRMAVGWAWLTFFVTCILTSGTGCGAGKYSVAAHAPEGPYREMAPEEFYEAHEPPPSPDSAVMELTSVSASGRMAQVAQARPRTEPSPKASPPAEAQPGEKPGEPTVASDAVPIQQVLIYTAQLRMAVFQVDKSLNEVEALARNLGGFLSQRTDTQITIRVPAAQFDEVLKGIAGLGDVLTRNVQVQDVTEEYLDVTLRLKNLRQVRDRIAQLLENAKNVEESLEVERELNRLSGEIERLEGRLKYLQSRAQYSTITVTFQPEHVETRPAFQLPFPWLRELGLGRLMNLR